MRFYGGVLCYGVLLTCAGFDRVGGAPGCVCLSCCGHIHTGDFTCPTAPTTLRATYCSGPSSGCSASTSAEWQKGCFGVSSKGIGGDCVCRTGEFKNPELYKIGGSAKGLPPHAEVHLLCLMPSATLPGVSTKMRTIVKAKGAHGLFVFPFRLAFGQSYHVLVEAVRDSKTGFRYKTVTCTVAPKPSSTPDPASNVATSNVELELMCKDGAKDAHTSVFARSKSTQSAVAARPDCQDSPLLLAPGMGMTPAERVATDESTSLPCKRAFKIHPNHQSKDGVYITEIRGHKCVHYSVQASKAVHVCFVQASTWYKLGAKAALSNPELCPCKSAMECTHTKKNLDIHTTYLLFSKEATDRSKPQNFHSYAEMSKSYEVVQLAVSVETCSQQKYSAAIKVGLLAGAAMLVLHFGTKGKKPMRGYTSVSGHEMASR